MRMVMVEAVMVHTNIHFFFRLCGTPTNVNSHHQTTQMPLRLSCTKSRPFFPRAQINGRPALANAALYVGQWVAPFLLLGIYNKMVKQHGSDVASK